MAIEFRALEFVIQKIKEYNPKITTRRGSAVYDFLITIATVLLEQYHLDLEDAFGDGSGLDNYLNLVEDRMDALVSNLIISRIEGDYGSQQARIRVDTVADYNFGEGELYATDDDGNRWYNTNNFSINEETLASQKDGGFYYFDMQFTSEEKSSDLGAITTLEDTSDFSGFVSIEGSETSLVDGIDRETNEELYNRAVNSIAVRDLVTEKGIRSILTEQFGGSFVDINPIGFGDPEMMRDIRFDFDGNKINLHLGGFTDIFLKSNKLTLKSADFSSLQPDTSREEEREFIVQLAGSASVFIGHAPLVSVDSVESLTGIELSLSDFTIDLSGGTIKSNLSLTIPIKVGVTYNPIAIDIKRTARSSREDQTITDLVFIKIDSIEELDSASGEPNGIVLERNGGYGQGGYGLGPYGIGEYGDWRYIVEYAHEKFSMLEESYIDFSYQHLGKDVRINFYCVPEWANVHDFCRDGSERVTAADVLPKNFLPIFVNGEIDVEVAASNSSAPTSDEVKEIVEGFIREFSDSLDLDLELVIGRLFEAGVVRVDKTFEWEGEIHHCNGVRELIRSDRSLSIPSPTLPKDTDMPISKEIARFYPGDITVSLTVRSDL
jgi:hypothetical protein